MSVIRTTKTLQVLSSAQITIDKVFDGLDAYNAEISNYNYNVLCDKNNNAIIGELGPDGRAVFTTSVFSKNSLTAVDSVPKTNQYSITIDSETSGCTANKKNANSFYIDTLTTGISGKVVIKFNIENRIFIKKEMSFNRTMLDDDLLEDGKFLIDGKFIFGKEHWCPNQNGTGDLGTNVKVVANLNDSKYGANLLEISNAQWVYAKQTINVEKDKIYRIKFRAKQAVDPITGGKTAYYGVTPYNGSNAAIGQDGAGNTYLTNGSLSTTQWTEHEYYISTSARPAITDISGNTIFKAVKAFPAETIKFRPMFLVNYDKGNGIAQVDSYIIQDATEDYSITELKNKTTKLEADMNGVTASVTTIKTITDMSTNPMTLVAKPNYSSYSESDDGEIYLHGLNDKRNPADVDGKCIWNGTVTTLPKTIYNHNAKVPDDSIIFMVRNKVDNKWWSIWKELDTNNAIIWKRMFANASTDSTIYNHTWNESNDIVVGYYVVKKTNPKDSEAPILTAQLFDGALTYSQAISMSLVGSLTQIQLLEDQMELKVQKNDIIASINLYTQTDNNGVTESGVKISGDKINLQGKVTFDSLADSSVDGSIKNVFTQENNRTVIDGGKIKTQTIEGNDLLLKGKLTVTKEDESGKQIKTFFITEEGDTHINGTLSSSNFSVKDNTGYQITPDGNAIFNQAIIKGDVILPSAGMTNYGAIVGNENLLINSDFSETVALNYVTDKHPNCYAKDWNGYNSGIANATTSYHAHVDTDTFGFNVIEFNESNGVRNWKGIQQTLIDKVKQPGEYTLSLDTYATLSGSKLFGGFYYYKVGETSPSFGSGQFTITSDISVEKWKRTSVKITLNKDVDFTKSISFYIYGYGFTSNAVCYIKNIKLENGVIATPWCVSSSEKTNHVRIWAGSDYENRNNAKFRVYDNGDIFATDGVFSGTMYGEIENENIHIKNGIFNIDNEKLLLNRSGVIKSESSAKEIINCISLSKNNAVFNVDTILGDISNPKVLYSNNGESLSIKNIDLSIMNATNELLFSKDKTWESFKIKSKINNSNSSICIGFDKTDSNSALISHTGGKGSTKYGDICFKDENESNDVDVNILGNITIRSSIKSVTHSVEMRSIENEGWGFFIV